MKKYLKVVVTTIDGTTFENPLMLSETRIIGQLVKDNKKVEVSLQQCTAAWYKLTFNNQINNNN